jgi:hypothetical protein
MAGDKINGNRQDDPMNKPESAWRKQALKKQGNSNSVPDKGGSERIECIAEIFRDLAWINVALHTEDADPAILQALIRSAEDVTAALFGATTTAADPGNNNQLNEGKESPKLEGRNTNGR